MKESLVEVSPSMVMQLNEASAACLTIASNAGCAMRASQATKPSMVAILGLIMPAPFEMPVSVTLLPPMMTVFDAALGWVSVVMIASAALNQLSARRLASAAGKPATILSTGRGSRMTPVENGKIYLVATSTGFFATDTLKGTSTVWVQQASGEIGNMVCDMFDVRLKDGTVALATHGNGIYSARLFNTTDILKTNDFTQVNFSVYPNPSRGEFSIRFAEKFKIISVEIIDDCGRLIKRMDQFEIDKNQYSCKSFKTGIYYLRMRLDNGKTITKLFNLTN